MPIYAVDDIAWEVLKSYVVVPMKRRFGYVISSKSFADCLDNEAERVRIMAEMARNNDRNSSVGFPEWMARAEMALKEARDLLGDFEMASKTCCYGTLPNPNFRYQFNKKADGKIEEIRQLAQDCSILRELNDISFSAFSPGNVAAPTPARREGKDVVQWTSTTASFSAALKPTKVGVDGIFKSRALMIRNIMDALANDSNSVVGVYGIGGVGKSTLLVDVERRIKEENSFDLVAKADVSEHPDIKMIQGEIADALGLKIKDKEFVGGRANLLHRRLKYEETRNTKVLIILDNLWKGLDLKSVGIPCGHDNKVIGCKLLLTSRNRDVLRRDMGCDIGFRLGGLQEDEAKELFERMVGDKVHDNDYKPVAT